MRVKLTLLVSTMYLNEIFFDIFFDHKLWAIGILFGQNKHLKPRFFPFIKLSITITIELKRY